ncbi:N-acetyltransferase family protein [Planococcus sp. FY231025]|uniref:GNAT family N-acetyltransferase n=1 Tax=Planococcus sp. FY231025 TaxID=3455699 RepID=UPI003F905394
MHTIMQEFTKNGKTYRIRTAEHQDAKELSEVRLQIDGETQYLDRERGEAFIDESGFEELIVMDSRNEKNLFLVALADRRIVGFSRCEGNSLKRFAHKAEFGVGILKEYWGYGIGKNLLNETIAWSEAAGIRKITLNVLQQNLKAISLYEKLRFKKEGLLVNDKKLADGQFHHTVIMGRFS